MKGKKSRSVRQMGLLYQSEYPEGLMNTNLSSCSVFNKTWHLLELPWVF